MVGICRAESGQTVISIGHHFSNTVLRHLLRGSGGAMAAMFVLLLASHRCAAAEVQVQVTDHDGKPVKDVVVTLSDDRTRYEGINRKWIMDQMNLRFVPQVLVVPTGAVVDFPNSDSVSHQVYSFSKTKRFQLSLYKGKFHPPVTFDKPGLVVVGCNIHDHMIGYIYVTSARWFGNTDAQGLFDATDVVSGKVTATIWSPYITDGDKALTRSVDLSDAHEPKRIEFKLIKPLRSAPEPQPRNPDWDY